MNLHDRRIKVAEQTLRVYLKDEDVVGSMTLKDLASRILHAVDKAVKSENAMLWREDSKYVNKR